MIYIGIDPGLTGVVAYYKDGKYGWADIPIKLKPGIVKGSKTFVKNQVDGSALAALLDSIIGIDEVRIVVERVGAMGGQGMSTAASLSHTVGIIEGVTTAMYESFVSVRPAVWMKALGLHGKKKVPGYNPMKEYVVNVLGIKNRINKDVADALCITAYCKEVS